MKKVLSVSVIATMLSVPSFATVQSGSTCDTATLGQSENNSTANIEATWTPNQYTVTYNCGDGAMTRQQLCLRLTGSKQCDAMYAHYGQSYTFVSGLYVCPLILGHTFSNWSCVDKNNSITTYTSDQVLNEWNIDSDLTCTAQWTANTINIDWYSDKQKLSVSNAAKQCTYGETITLPQEPTKTGYTFNGWVLYDICPDLSIKSECNANSNCGWSDTDNTCINLGSCEGLGESECKSKSYCEAMETSIIENGEEMVVSYNGCAISMDLICSKNSTSDSCSELRFCAWNTETNKCEFHDMKITEDLTDAGSVIRE